MKTFCVDLKCKVFGEQLGGYSGYITLHVQAESPKRAAEVLGVILQELVNDRLDKNAAEEKVS